MADVKVSVGIVIEVKGTKIPLIPKESAPGVIEVGLQAGMKVDIGAVSECLDDVVGFFKPDWKWDTEKAKLKANMPEQLVSAIETVLVAHLSIEQLHLKLTSYKADQKINDDVTGKERTVTPDEIKNGKREFTLGMSLTWLEGGPAPQFASVTLRGLYLNVTNEGTALIESK